MKHVSKFILFLMGFTPFQIEAHEGEFYRAFYLFKNNKVEETCWLYVRPIIVFSPDNNTARVTMLHNSGLTTSEIPLDGAEPFSIKYIHRSSPDALTGTWAEKWQRTETENRKVISNGQLIIVKDNKIYNINGTERK